MGMEHGNQPEEWVEEWVASMDQWRTVFALNDLPTSWGTSSYDPELLTESVSDPVELERSRLKLWGIAILFLRAIRSRLKIVPKNSIIESTTELGVHGGKVQAEITEWEPRTMNGFSPPSPFFFVSRSRKTKHTGQHRFDTPSTRPKCCFYNKKGKKVRFGEKQIKEFNHRQLLQ